MRPQFNYAKRFLGHIDQIVYPNLDGLSVSLATTLFPQHPGSTYAISFAVLMLFAGSLQWFLIGRLIQWLSLKRRYRTRALLIAGLLVWVSLVTLLWVM